MSRTGWLRDRGSGVFRSALIYTTIRTAPPPVTGPGVGLRSPLPHEVAAAIQLSIY